MSASNSLYLLVVAVVVQIRISVVEVILIHAVDLLEILVLVALIVVLAVLTAEADPDLQVPIEGDLRVAVVLQVKNV